MFFALCCSATLIMAQKSVTAYVFDADTKKPVDLVTVISPIDYTITNSEGGFAVKVMENEKIVLSHISYQTINIDLQQLSDTIFLKPRVYRLAEIVVVPKSVIVKELKEVWGKYNKLLARKREKDFPQQTFYYRQLTQYNDLYTEYLECFFEAPVSTHVMTMTMMEGRYAGINKDSLGTIINYFCLSQLPPFSRYRAQNYNAVNGFLVKNFEKYYDIRLDRTISQGNEDEVRVYEFIPYEEMISDNAMMLSGFLYIRKKDLSIVRMEINSKSMLLTGIPNVVDESYNFTVTYRDGVEPYPVVETVKGETEITHIYFGKKCPIKLYSVLFATDYKIEKKGKRVKQFDNLFQTVADSKYNQEFWDNNPIIKRTKIEQQVVDDFTRLGYFGSMKLDN